MAEADIFDMYDQEAPVTKSEFKEGMEKIAEQISSGIGNLPNGTTGMTNQEEIKRTIQMQERLEKIEETVNILTNGTVKLIKHKEYDNLLTRIITLENKINSKSKFDDIKEPWSVKPPKTIVKMSFDMGESYKIDHWYEIVPKTLEYLIKLNKFTLFEKIKDFINITPYTRNGAKYKHIIQIAGYSINKYGSVEQLKDRVKLLLESCGLDPNSVTFEEKIIQYEKNDNKNRIKQPKPPIPQPPIQKPSPPPIKMTFPDDKEYPIKFWKDILISTAVHFINQENLVITDEIKNFVNTTPYTRSGSKYRGYEKFDNYYINTWFSSQQLQKHADLLMKIHNIDINSIIYETTDGKEYVKPGKPTSKHKKKRRAHKRSKKSSKPAPNKMIFPDGAIYEIKKWNKILQSVVKYLVSKKKLILHDKLKSFINTTPYTETGGKYHTFVQFGDYYINTNANRKLHQDRANVLMWAHGIDPESIIYE